MSEMRFPIICADTGESVHSYDDYRKTLHWEKLKAAYRQNKLPWTCSCGAKRGVDIYHRTYERLGRERLEDLLPLCRECHSSILRSLEEDPTKTLRQLTGIMTKSAQSNGRKIPGKRHLGRKTRGSHYDKAVYGR